MAKRAPAVVVTGDKELDKLLHAFEPKLQKSLTRKATRVAAKIVQEAAIRKVPIASGTLESVLKVRAMRRRKGRNRRGKFGHSVMAQDGFFMGDTFYGGFLEFGTKQRKHKSGKSVGEIEPGRWDYLRPALYENKKEIQRLFQVTLRQEIRDAAKKQ